jgi:hypothetical protein
VMAAGPVGFEEARRVRSKLSASNTGFTELREEAFRRIGAGESSRLSHLTREIRVSLGAGNGLLEQTISSRHPLLAWGTKEGVEVNRELKEMLCVQQALSVPVISRTSAVGVVLADNLYTEKPISPLQVELLSALARHAGLAWENVSP